MFWEREEKVAGIKYILVSESKIQVRQLSEPASKK
jgi:hypothetical protein